MTYEDGQPKPLKPGEQAKPKPCSLHKGTLLLVEDLFYNLPTRRKALTNPAEQYRLILDIVKRYAINNTGVGFTCKKAGESLADVQTSPAASTTDNIRTIFGESVANVIVPVQGESKPLGFSFTGYVSNLNYDADKNTFILFINGNTVSFLWSFCRPTGFKQRFKESYSRCVHQQKRSIDPFLCILELESDS